MTGPGLQIDILVEADGWPLESRLESLARRAVDAVLADLAITAAGSSEVSLVFSDDAQIRILNAQWRGQDKPTNVLSFPAYPYERGAALPPMLGDIILARETVEREAQLEHKPFDHHLSHLLVHGMLHLLGYDHEDEEEAEEMESAERRMLVALAIPDPYA